ncbi:MAG: hypothetical protein SGPRY_001881 [Prymnesium sp.]
MHSVKRARPSQSHLVQCPCCTHYVHRLLINDHLEVCSATPRTSSVSPPNRADASPYSLSQEARQLWQTGEPTEGAGGQGKERGDGSDGREAREGREEGEGGEAISDLVACPVCGVQLPNDRVFEHLENECSPPQLPQTPSTAPTPPLGGGVGGGLSCPACGVCVASEEELNSHLDRDCSSFIDGRPTPTGGKQTPPPIQTCGEQTAPPCSELPPPATHEDEAKRPPPDGRPAEEVFTSKEVLSTREASSSGKEPPSEDALPSRVNLSKLGAELQCPICMDLFEAPHSLPCQHSFCRDCIMDSFRLHSKMQCPLCHAPTWRRELKPNHLLQGIVTAFRQITPEDRAQ